jgi:hypothetical protein
MGRSRILHQTFAKEESERDFSMENFQRFAERRITERSVEDITFEILFAVAKRMRELIKNERNFIWTFILKNVYKTTFLYKQFDWILGNSAWLSFRYHNPDLSA